MIEFSVDTDSARALVVPAHGKPRTFVVEHVNCPRHYSTWVKGTWRGRKYVVRLEGSTGLGFIHHADFERACRSLLYRARRYDRAYSRPRGLAAKAAA